ncbi:Glycerol-3-phosphate acyltransferase [subsurface metagenome]
MVWGSMFAIIMGYLLGSFPSAYIAGRLLRGVDIRGVGDSNMGAANAWHELGARAGIVVLIADVGKGAAAMLIATVIGVSLPALLLTGLAVVAGHNWPLFLGFRGGKGAATTFGVLLTQLPYPMLILLGVALIPFAITRNVNLAGAFLFSPAALVAWWLDASGALIAYSILLPCMVGLTHFITTRNPPLEVKERRST